MQLCDTFSILSTALVAILIVPIIVLCGESSSATRSTMVRGDVVAGDGKKVW